MDTLQADFGKVVRRRRLELGLGQEKLADEAGLHRTHVSLLERGKRMPSLRVVQKLASALKTTMASLVGELEGDGGVAESAGEKADRRAAPRRATAGARGRPGRAPG